MSKIKKIRKKKPNFPRVGAKMKKKVDGSKWRKPKGMHGRVKKLLSYHKGAAPDIGYGSPKKIRGKHVSGLEIVEVKNINELLKVDAKSQIVKIANVGKKKKLEIIEKAIQKGIKISNLRKPKEYISKNKIAVEEVKK